MDSINELVELLIEQSKNTKIKWSVNDVNFKTEMTNNLFNSERGYKPFQVLEVFKTEFKEKTVVLAKEMDIEDNSVDWWIYLYEPNNFDVRVGFRTTELKKPTNLGRLALIIKRGGKEKDDIVRETIGNIKELIK